MQQRIFPGRGSGARSRTRSSGIRFAPGVEAGEVFPHRLETVDDTVDRIRRGSIRSVSDSSGYVHDAPDRQQPGSDLTAIAALKEHQLQVFSPMDNLSGDRVRSYGGRDRALGLGSAAVDSRRRAKLDETALPCLRSPPHGPPVPRIRSSRLFHSSACRSSVLPHDTDTASRPAGGRFRDPPPRSRFNGEKVVGAQGLEPWTR